MDILKIVLVAGIAVLIVYFLIRQVVGLVNDIKHRKNGSKSESSDDDRKEDGSI